MVTKEKQKTSQTLPSNQDSGYLQQLEKDTIRILQIALSSTIEKLLKGSSALNIFTQNTRVKYNLKSPVLVIPICHKMRDTQIANEVQFSASRRKFAC